MQEGHEWNPKFKNHIWDGQIRLFKLNEHTLSLGLIPELLLWAKREKLTVEMEPEVKKRVYNNSYNEKEVNDYLDSLNIVLDNGTKIEFWEEQRFAVHIAIKYGRTLLQSPTSTGKSLIAFTLIEWYLRQNLEGQFLLTVPGISLVGQMADNFIEYMTDDCILKPEDIHQIYDNSEKNTNHKLTISTWQGIYKLPQTWFERFTFSILDEAHLAKGKSLQLVHDKLVNAKYRIGMTGTLDGTQVHKLIVEGCTGRTNIITTNKKMMDQGKTTPIKISSVMFDYPHEESFAIKGFTYQEEMKYITVHEKRAKMLSQLCQRTKGNTLVLFNNINHGEALFEQFRIDAKGKEIYLLYGKHDTNQRKEVIDIMEAQDNVIVLASYGIFSTGVSINNIMNVVLGSPTKSRIRLLQSIGRGLRLAKNKKFVRLFDIIDDFTYLKRGGKNTHENYAYKHAIERLSIYVSEEFDYKISRIKL
ncbi:MAG: DEAD/DEAH box helicase family protein [Candidatus Izemoplasma sp.]